MSAFRRDPTTTTTPCLPALHQEFPSRISAFPFYISFFLLFDFLHRKRVAGVAQTLGNRSLQLPARTDTLGRSMAGVHAGDREGER